MWSGACVFFGKIAVSWGGSMILATREERVKLLRAGFPGSEIEKLYVVLNSFDVIKNTWLPILPEVGV